MSAMVFRFAGRSEIGNIRTNNEDAGYASNDVLIVADGMGGHAAGELASAATVASVVASTSKSLSTEDILDALGESVIVSGEQIADVVAANRELTGMGTTLTTLVLREDRVAIAHVGDSRAYLLRDNKLQRLTKDHTYVQSLVDAGEITPEEAAVHPRRNLMMRAIDGIHPAEPDLSIREAQLGDRYLLCSDGLCGVISDEIIFDCLSREDLPDAVTRLIDEAIAHGGPDNVTVVVAELVTLENYSDPIVLGAAIDDETKTRLPDVDFPNESDELADITQVFYVSPRNNRGRLQTISLVLLALVFAALMGFWWLSNQWYIGVSNNLVSVYKGIPSVGLHVVTDVTTLHVNELPAFEKSQVTKTINQTSRESALETIGKLKLAAQLCKSNPTPGCPGVQ